MYDIYYDTNLEQTITNHELFTVKNYPTDEQELRNLGIYPIRVNRDKEYDSLEFDLIPDNDLVFNKEDQVYDQNFHLIKISEDEQEQRKLVKQKELDIKRKAEILDLFKKLDNQSIRAIRSISVALANNQTPDSLDIQKLTELEKQVVQLREELQDITDRLGTD